MQDKSFRARVLKSESRTLCVKLQSVGPPREWKSLPTPCGRPFMHVPESRAGLAAGASAATMWPAKNAESVTLLNIHAGQNGKCLMAAMNFDKRCELPLCNSWPQCMAPMHLDMRGALALCNAWSQCTSTCGALCPCAVQGRTHAAAHMHAFPAFPLAAPHGRDACTCATYTQHLSSPGVDGEVDSKPFCTEGSMRGL
jgi:hypothetical protein